MSQSGQSRELAISQSHVGTTLLAGIIGLVGTCLAATMVTALIFQIASLYGWLACLSLPAVALVLVTGSLLVQWSERHLPRVWPSGKRLVLDKETLTLAQRSTVRSQIRWNQPFTVLRWRMGGLETSGVFGTPRDHLRLASQLMQREQTIIVYTGCSPQEWRRVPGWKQFSLLESNRRPGQSGVFRELVAQTALLRRAAPAHRGASSLPEGDPKMLWPAELNRRRRGWELSFEDFCTLMMAIEQASAV